MLKDKRTWITQKKTEIRPELLPFHFSCEEIDADIRDLTTTTYNQFSF